jgi:membrane protease YdiL (CAAX protease family)
MKIASALSFFVWVLTLSTPFYVWGVAAPVRGLPFGLPATAIMVVVPAIVATAHTWRKEGTHAALGLWRRLFDIERVSGFIWIVAALLTMPLASIAGYAVMTMLGRTLPGLTSLPLCDAPLMPALYLAGAALEELGWTGYATEPLQRRYGIPCAGAIIGSVWALWHLIPWWLGQGHALVWVASQTLATILMRIIMGYVYDRGGRSVSLAVIFHAMINVSYSLFPREGSHYDPLVLAPILALVAFALFLSRSRVERG